MARAGGTAAIVSSPGSGTEVELTAAAEGVVKPRVVLVDDHELFRAGVRGELGAKVEIVGEAGTVAEAVPLITRARPGRRPARRPPAGRRRRGGDRRRRARSGRA